MARGGKRSGAGRKPIHTKRKLANFSTRITPELRDALEREAKRSGHSLSQEVERRLTDSLQAPKRTKETWGEDRNLGLAYLVNRTAQIIENHTGGSWVTNDYTFRALRAAIAELFRILDVESSAPRNPDMPEKLARLIESMKGQGYIDSKTPESSGLFFANAVWTNVMLLEMPADPKRTVHEAFRVLAKMRRLLEIRATPGQGVSGSSRNKRPGRDIPQTTLNPA